MTLREWLWSLFHRVNYDHELAHSREQRQETVQQQREIARRLEELGIYVEVIRRRRGTDDE